MTRVFVKWYNPAYDYFIVKFFSGRGIPFNDEATLREMRSRLPPQKRADPSKLLPHEKMFLFYLGQWSLHPESRPSQIEFLTSTFADHRLSVTRLEELEGSLPPERGKLLLAQEDAAAEIFKFYRRVIVEPLRKNIEKKASAWKLLDYFNVEDRVGLPYSKEVDRRDFEKAVKVTAGELLSWLKKIDSQTVSSDISLVFQQHSEKGHHMEPIGPPHEDGRRTIRCEHNSKLVQLHYSREPEDFEDHLLLQPARGYGVVEDGWKDVVFPRFNVLEKPEKDFPKNITPKSPFERISGLMW